MKRAIWLISGFAALVALAIVIAGAGGRGPALPEGAVADRVLIDKSQRTLTLMRGDDRLKSYRVSLGWDPIGHKQEEGDGRTPEGVYAIDFRKRDSAYHRALHISYPNTQDARAANERGVSPGGDIMIHGLRNGLGAVGALHQKRDWTAGCIAVTNREIEEIWRAVPDDTPVEITP